MPTVEERAPSLAHRIKEVALFALTVGAPAMLVAVVRVPSEGPAYCEDALRATYPAVANSTTLSKRVWTRTWGDHWISALVLLPHDLSARPVTVVCHFTGTNYVEPRLELFDGDRTGALKDISRSNLDPRTWLE